MTTTELIELLKKYELGGATGNPREVMFEVDGRIIDTNGIEVTGSGDGLISELYLSLPAAQPPIDEWCYKCKEYDSDRNCCPRFDRIIGKALEDLQPQRMRGRWIYGSPVTMKCDQCGYFIADWRAAESNYCPSCGADMRGGEQDG